MESQQWVLDQIRTFTEWINDQLKNTISYKISDLFEDLSDGTILSNLLMTLTGKEVPICANPQSEYQKIENIQSGLDFIKEQGVKLVNIGAKDIYDKKKKIILGLIWTLILRLGGRNLPEGGEQLTVLNWCKNCTSGYRDVEIDDFSNSWKDGMAFNAIIHHFRPDLVDYDSLRKENARENLQNAFDIAEKHFNISQLMTPEGFIDRENPDEKCVYTYVLRFYNKFLEEKKKQMKENVKKITNETISYSIRTQNDYEKRASELLELKNSYKTHTNELNDLISQVITKIQENYEMSQNIREKYLQILNYLGNINTIHQFYDIKPYVPSQELSPDRLRYEIPPKAIFDRMKIMIKEANDYSEEQKYFISGEFEKLLQSSEYNEEFKNKIEEYMKSNKDVSEKNICKERLELINKIDEYKNFKKNKLVEAEKNFEKFAKNSKGKISRKYYEAILDQLGVDTTNYEGGDEITYDDFIYEIQKVLNPFHNWVRTDYYPKNEEEETFLHKYVLAD